MEWLFCKKCSKILSLKEEDKFCSCGEPKPDNTNKSVQEKIINYEKGEGSVNQKLLIWEFGIQMKQE
jgi:hypothetical protein